MKFSRAIVTAVACAALVGCGQPAQEQPAQPVEPKAEVSEPSPELTPEATPDVEPAQPEPTEPEAEAESEAVETPSAVRTEPEPAPPPAAVRPAAFARCQACHSVEPGAGHGIGPNLVGVMGARVGSQSGYNYSDAMANSDQTWTSELMDAFLLAPREAVPGTKMMAAPVRDPADRQALIEFLSALR